MRRTTTRLNFCIQCKHLFLETNKSLTFQDVAFIENRHYSRGLCIDCLLNQAHKNLLSISSTRNQRPMIYQAYCVKCPNYFSKHYFKSFANNKLSCAKHKSHILISKPCIEYNLEMNRIYVYEWYSAAKVTFVFDAKYLDIVPPFDLALHVVEWQQRANEMYSGFVKNGKRSGSGTVQFGESTIERITCLWEQYVPDANSSATVKYKDGTEYYGKISATFAKHGKGKVVYLGNVPASFECQWNNDTPSERMYYEDCMFVGTVSQENGKWYRNGKGTLFRAGM